MKIYIRMVDTSWWHANEPARSRMVEIELTKEQVDAIRPRECEIQTPGNKTEYETPFLDSWDMTPAGSECEDE